MVQESLQFLIKHRLEHLSIRLPFSFTLLYLVFLLFALLALISTLCIDPGQLPSGARFVKGGTKVSPSRCGEWIMALIYHHWIVRRLLIRSWWQMHWLRDFMVRPPFIATKSSRRLTCIWVDRLLNDPLVAYIKDLTGEQCHLFRREICHFYIVQLFIFITIPFTFEEVGFRSFMDTFLHFTHTCSDWVRSLSHHLWHMFSRCLFVLLGIKLV